MTDYDAYGCYRCGFNHDTDQTCTEARTERHRAYAEECKRIAAEAVARPEQTEEET